MYAAPEQLLGRRCTLAADVYSLGLLLVELTTGQVIARRGAWHLPHAPDDCPQARRQRVQLSAAAGRGGVVPVANGPIRTSIAVSDSLQAVVDLIEACLASAPSDRPLAAEVFRRLQKQG